MPGLFGGGGGSGGAPVNAPPSGSAPGEFFTPPGQGAAAGSYTSLLNNLLGQYTSGSTPPQQIYPNALTNAGSLSYLTSPGGLYNTILNQEAANPYYGGAQDAANAGAGIFGGQQQLLANDLNAAITGGFAGEMGQANYLSGLPGQANTYAQAQAGLAPTVAGLGGTAAGEIPGIERLASYLGGDTGLAESLMGYALPFAGNISKLASRPEGISALQGGAQNVLDKSQALYNTPTGAGGLMTAGQGILDQGKALAARPTGADQLMRGSTNLLNAGYDPQNALRNQLTRQTADQSSALNAMSGLASSPYGAGLSSDALNNFNINWQNQQLGREQAALSGATAGFEGAGQLRQNRQNLLTNAAGAAGQAFGEASNLRQGRENLLTSGLGAASGAFGQAGNLLANKANMYSQALSGAEGLYQGAGGLATQAANALAQGAGVAGTAGGLYGQAGGLYGGATSGVGTSGNLAREAGGLYGSLPGTANAATAGVGALASGAAGAGALPGQAYNQQLGAETTALNNYIAALNQAQGGLTSASNIGTAGYALPESVLSSLGNYLKLGQNASLGSATLGEIGTANQSAALGGINTLLGGGAGIGSTLFGSGGLSGALGLGDSGLLGSLLGGGLSPGAAGAASGFGDAFASNTLDLGALFL